MEFVETRLQTLHSLILRFEALGYTEPLESHRSAISAVERCPLLKVLELEMPCLPLDYHIEIDDIDESILPVFTSLPAGLKIMRLSPEFRITEAALKMPQGLKVPELGAASTNVALPLSQLQAMALTFTSVLEVPESFIQLQSLQYLEINFSFIHRSYTISEELMDAILSLGQLRVLLVRNAQCLWGNWHKLEAHQSLERLYVTFEWAHIEDFADLLALPQLFFLSLKPTHGSSETNLTQGLATSSVRHLRLRGAPSVEQLDISSAQKLETVKLKIDNQSGFWEAKALTKQVKASLAKQVEASQGRESSLAWAKIEYPVETGQPFCLRSSKAFIPMRTGRQGWEQAVCYGKSPAQTSTQHLTAAVLDNALISQCEEYGTAHILAGLDACSYSDVLKRRLTLLSLQSYYSQYA